MTEKESFWMKEYNYIHDKMKWYEQQWRDGLKEIAKLELALENKVPTSYIKQAWLKHKLVGIVKKIHIQKQQTFWEKLPHFV